MVPRHSSNEVAADRKRGQQRTQCWQCGEKKACCALGLLPDWERKRLGGVRVPHSSNAVYVVEAAKCCRDVVPVWSRDCCQDRRLAHVARRSRARMG
jgi:hypothetical protein